MYSITFLGWPSPRFLSLLFISFLNTFIFLFLLPSADLSPPSSYFRLIVEFQWFFIALSVLKFDSGERVIRANAREHLVEGVSQPRDESYRPGNNLAIFAHWFPHDWWAWYISLSSSSVQAVFLIFGFRWLCHLSRHCFPIRPFNCLAISVHFLGPYFRTSSTTFSSSCGWEFHFVSKGQLWRNAKGMTR